MVEMHGEPAQDAQLSGPFDLKGLEEFSDEENKKRGPQQDRFRFCREPIEPVGY